MPYAQEYVRRAEGNPENSNAWVRAQIEQMDAEYARLLAVKHPDAHTVQVAHRSTRGLVTKMETLTASGIGTRSSISAR